MAIGSVSGSTSQPVTLTDDSITSAGPVDTGEVSVGTSTAASCFAPATGPSGTVEYGGVDYVCKNGKVFVGDSEVGTVNDAGDYNVTLQGQSYTGSVGKLIGASVHGELSDGTEVDIDEVGHAGPGERELKPGEGFDPFGNLVLWHQDPKTGVRDGYRVIEHAPANLDSNGNEVVAQSYNSKYPEQSYREFSNGTRVPWDGKTPELAKPKVSPAEAEGPTAASKAIVEALKKEYLAATGVPLNQGQLELVGYTQSVRDPEYLQLLQKQGQLVTAAYDKALGRPPTTAERLYWVNLSTDVAQMRRSVESLSNPLKTSQEYLQNIANAQAKYPTTNYAAVAPAGDLPAQATKQGLMGAETEQALLKERRPLMNPSFVTTPEDRAAFEKLRAASKLRGTDITDNPSSAGWAQQMLASGTARDPAFYKMIDSTIEAVRAAYQKQLSRAPTQTELAEWVPFTANMEYNRRRAAEVLVDLQNKAKIDEITQKILRR